MGVSVDSVYPGDISPEERKKPIKPKRAPAKKKESDDKTIILWNGPHTDYQYTAMDGSPLIKRRLQTVKEKSGEKGKTFVWYHVVNGRTENGTDHKQPALYHADRIPEWVAAGTTIYVVEGEKDCDNMISLGLACVTAPHGAQKSGDPGGKWLPDHTASLAGADVVLCMDVDEAGRKFSAAVSMKLSGHVGKLREINLLTTTVELPENGDITDMIEAVGPDEALRYLRQLTEAATPIGAVTVENEAVEVVDEYQKIVDCYNNLNNGYCVMDGGIGKWERSGPVKMCRFVAYPAVMTTLDNGTGEKQKEL